MAASWHELGFRRLWPSDLETSSWGPLQTARDQQIGNRGLMNMTMCFRRISGSANIRWLVSARGAGVCRLYTAAWRYGHTPVIECGRLKEPPLNGAWFFRLKGTGNRVACWNESLQQVKLTHWHAQETVPSRYRGLHERSVYSYPLSFNARGFCSGKPTDTLGSSPPPDRNDNSPVPGHGLFKFKELVSTTLLSRC